MLRLLKKKPAFSNAGFQIIILPGFNSSIRLWIFITLPENQRQHQTGQRQAGTEFIDDVWCDGFLQGQRRKYSLDKEVVAGMQQRGRPEAPGSIAQPTESEVQAGDHKSEHDSAIPARNSRRDVISEEDQRQVPYDPNRAGDQGGLIEREQLLQFREEQPAPADFLAGAGEQPAEYSQYAQIPEINNRTPDLRQGP